MEYSQKDIDYVFSILKDHSKTKGSFLNHLQGLGPKKKKFLRLATIYGVLVKKSHFPTTDFDNDDEIQIGFINDTFKFISLMSLIEALYSDKDYKDFYQWLINKKQRSLLSILKKENLDEIYQKYTDFHGSTKKAVRFFQDIPDNHRYILEQGIEHYKIKKYTDGRKEVELEDTTIDQIAKTLYKIRSNFIHNAEIVTDISGIYGLSIIDNRIIISNLSLEKLCVLFEIVFLRKYGFEFE